MNQPSLLFATGGTGGHIYPAIAIAKEAKKRGYSASFIGQREGMEAEIVPQEGFGFHGVSAGKWHRGKPQLKDALKALRGFVQALSHMRQQRPDLIIGFGGFASFPGLAAARLLGLPYVLHEGNAYAGKVIRWFSSGAKAVAISHQDLKTQLPRVKSDRFVNIGFPVREVKVDKLKARKALGLPKQGLVTLVMGGSQGSITMNTHVPQAFAALEAATTVLHSTGKNWEEDVKKETLSFSNYFTASFVDATLAWSASDLAITRAGVSTLSEAAFHGVPSIMIPLPSAAENHQFHNAQAVASLGAGWVVEEENLAKLSSVWQQALEDGQRKPAMQAAQALSPEGAAEAFVNLIDRLLSTTKASAGVSRQESQ